MSQVRTDFGASKEQALVPGDMCNMWDSTMAAAKAMLLVNHKELVTGLQNSKSTSREYGKLATTPIPVLVLPTTPVQKAGLIPVIPLTGLNRMS